MTYESLKIMVEEDDIEIHEMKLAGRLKGLYSENVIAISNKLETDKEKVCVLAEEIGHHHTSIGNILDLDTTINIKQEKRARNWAYEKLISIDSLIVAFNKGISGSFELSEFLNVTEDFLSKSIEHLKEKHGTCVSQDNYTLLFYPSLGIIKSFAVKNT